MTRGLTDAEKAFVEFDWEASEKWKQYFNNLFPAPPADKLPKYKRTWFRRTVNPHLPLESTVGDFETTENSNTTTEHKTESSTASNLYSKFNFLTPKMSTEILVKVELAARVIFLVSTLLMLVFRLTKILPPKLFLPFSVASVTSFFVFLFVALFKDKGRPTFSLDYARLIMMDENVHYLAYGLAVMNLPKALVILGPEILTCVLGLTKLYYQYKIYFPKMLLVGPVRTLLMRLDSHHTQILAIRGTLEAAALFHMIIGIFINSSNIISILLYANFLRLKVAVNDVYLIGAFKQLNGVIVKLISHQVVPPSVRNGYAAFIRTVTKYFQPARPTGNGQNEMVSLAQEDYVAPKIYDAFLKRLGRLVRVLNLPPKAVRKDHESSDDVSSWDDNDWETEEWKSGTDQQSFSDEDRQQYNISRISLNPRLSDMMLTTDLWRSRLVTGRNMSNRYSVISDAIGFGVGGSVHQAIDRKSHRTFALKTLHTDAKFRKKLISTFNEIAIYTQLDHPNIAFLHEVYEEAGACNILMEHCSGGELYDRLEKYKRFSEDYTKGLIVQMLLAINYLHSNGICHRDLKLENWVFTSQDMTSAIKMIDFGFSRLYEDGVPMAGTHGTVYYVDPEVIDGCYSEKCDIWSTGVIVYMLLSGSPPFNGEGDKEILWKIKKGSLRFDGVRWNKISNEAKEFISFLLNRDSTKRASAIDALKHHWLNDELHHFDSSVITTDVLRYIVEFSRRSPMYRALVAMCVLEADRQVHTNAYRLFFAINTSLSGSISLKEFTYVMREYLNMEEQEAAVVFDTIAFRGAPKMHYTEFIASVYGYYTELDLQLLTQVYYKLESLGDGQINIDTFIACMGEHFNGVPVTALFEEVDVDKKGVIELADLQKCLVSVH
ncbi:calcium-dependent kinase [Babesia ovis]|uniref:Calcium-dependent kinase n=1 Tax=Babesia ovis TaxID=5869 RepID=A0A9W5TC97_BABOV|nr:calcium-dependent kinase [Babesia ovis]